MSTTLLPESADTNPTAATRTGAQTAATPAAPHDSLAQVNAPPARFASPRAYPKAGYPALEIWRDTRRSGLRGLAADDRTAPQPQSQPTSTPAINPRDISPLAATVALGAIVVMAAVLRGNGAGSIFRSLDYAEVAFRVTHFWGWTWTLESAYGPLQPIITRLFAILCTSMGLTMDESLWRMPAIACGALTGAALFAMLRELGAQRWVALAAAALAAVAPASVSADRYPYSAESFGLLWGLLTVWTALRHGRIRSVFSAWTFGLTCAVCLASHLLLHALPIALAGAAWLTTRGATTSERWSDLKQTWRRIGAWTPPAAMIALHVAVYLASRGGVIGHLLYKNATTDTGWITLADLSLHATWFARQLGWAGFVFALLGATAAWSARTTRPAATLLLCWMAAFLAPVILLHHYSGRMYGYYLQPVMLLIGLACLALPQLVQRIGRRPTAAVVAFVWLGLLGGSVSTVFAGDRYAALTGISCPIGAATPDPGYKSAGWYVRTHVPADKVVFTPHDADGLEYMTAGYYLGRNCLSAENLTRDESRRLLTAFADRIDIAVVESDFAQWFADPAAWRRVAVVMSAGRQTLGIYARPGITLPLLTLDTTTFNAAFDAVCAPRRFGALLPTPPRLPSGREIMAAARPGK